jgi:membrane protein required for beta-lactamase induction
MSKPIVGSLSNVTLAEADAYMRAANDNELRAALHLAQDRVELDGSEAAPDETEIHHALFLLRHARGLEAPSFDAMRVELRTALVA